MSGNVAELLRGAFFFFSNLQYAKQSQSNLVGKWSCFLRNWKRVKQRSNRNQFFPESQTKVLYFLYLNDDLFETRTTSFLIRGTCYHSVRHEIKPSDLCVDKKYRNHTKLIIVPMLETHQAYYGHSTHGQEILKKKCTVDNIRLCTNRGLCNGYISLSIRYCRHQSTISGEKCLTPTVEKGVIAIP